MSNTLDVFNPSTGLKIKTIVCDDENSIEQKISQVDSAFNGGDNDLSMPQRLAILKSLHATMKSKESFLAGLIAQEGGKPLKDAIVEAQRAATTVELAISHLMTAGSATTPLNTASPDCNHQMTVTHKAIGPVVAVSAFNHPLNLVTHQLISAFAAGCPCVIKPAGDTPLSCLELVKMLHEAGAPEEWAQCVVTEHIPHAEKLVTDPRFAFFSFIGSAKVGWYLRSKLSPGTRAALEHGGVAPAFVDKHTDLHQAATSLVRGGYYHAGQVCVSTQRIYIHQDVFSEFCGIFSDLVKQLNVGDASDINTDVGPLIRQAEVERVHSWVSEAQEQGAELLLGGVPMSGQYYQPTILLNAPADAKVNSLEIFGPVTSLMAYQDLDAVIAQVNKENVAFHSAVFSDSQRTINRLYKKLYTGCLMVNEHTAFRHDSMRFAGLKHSGLGAGGVFTSIEEMQIEKLMITNTKFTY